MGKRFHFLLYYCIYYFFQDRDLIYAYFLYYNLRKPTSEKLNDPNLWKPYSTKNNIHLQIGNIDNNTDPTVTISNFIERNRMNFWEKNYKNLRSPAN